MQRPQRHLFALLALSLCAALWFSPVAVSAEEPATAPGPLPLQTALEDLDSPIPAVRDLATTDLMIREDFGNDQLARAMKETKTPERRLRLIRIATHRFFAAIPVRGQAVDHDTGSLGVNLSNPDPSSLVVHPYQMPALQSTGVLITATLPGFPAYAYLRPGDVITAIDGQTFPDDIDQPKFMSRIVEFSPGQIMTIDLLRDGVKMRLKVKLDSKQRLNEIYTQQIRPQEVFNEQQKYIQALTDTAQPAPQIQLDFPAPPAGTPTAAAIQPNQGVIQVGPNVIIRGNVIRAGGVIQIMPDARVKKKVGN